MPFMHACMTVTVYTLQFRFNTLECSMLDTIETSHQDQRFLLLSWDYIQGGVKLIKHLYTNIPILTDMRTYL